MVKKKVFIGSSTEALDEVERVSEWLKDANVVPLPWNAPGLFPPGRYLLNRLIEISTEVNGAVLLFSPDDKTWYRKGPVIQPRDNVILEYGLFVSRLGEPAAIICRKAKPKFPTDLGGLLWLDISEKKNKAELMKWANDLPGNPGPRISLLGSTTEDIEAKGKLTEALKEFYRQFIHQCTRSDLGINTCGAEPFLSVAYQFYYEKVLLAHRSREWVAHHEDRIRWYWHHGGQGGVNYCPPIFTTQRTASVEDRTKAEVEDSDLILAVSGREGTVRQLERILNDGQSNPRRKPVVIVGWFGGQVRDFVANLPPDNPVVIRNYDGLDFTEIKHDWPTNTKPLATALAKAVHKIIVTRLKAEKTPKLPSARTATG